MNVNNQNQMLPIPINRYVTDFPLVCILNTFP
jgi:hypothetical protein